MANIITKYDNLVRASGAPDYPDGTNVPYGITRSGALIVQSNGLERVELVRQGHSWSCTIATASAFAPVAAMPTTLTNLELYNGEPQGGKCYVIDTVSAMNLTTQAAAGSITIVVQVIPGVVAPTDDANQLITSLSGKKTYTGNAKRAVAGTRATADKWVILGGALHYPATSIGSGTAFDCQGKFIIPPGCGFGINCVHAQAAGTAIQGVVWHEVQLHANF